MLQRLQPYTLLTTLAVFRHFHLPIRTVGTPAATFYYVSSPGQLFFLLRFLQALPIHGYNPRPLVFQPRLPQVLPHLMLHRPQP